jgi:hypothetical protein
LLVPLSPKSQDHDVTGPPVLDVVKPTNRGILPLVCDAEIVTIGGWAGETIIGRLAEFDPPGPVAVTVAVYVPAEVYV